MRPLPETVPELSEDGFCRICVAAGEEVSIQQREDNERHYRVAASFDHAVNRTPWQ